MQVDRPLVAFLEGAKAVDLAHILPAVPKQDPVAGAAAAQVNIALGELAGRKPGGAVRSAEQVAGPGQAIQDGRGLGHGAQRVRQGKGRLSRGAGQVLTGDSRILRVEDDRFHLAGEEIIGVAHEMLVQGVFVADEHHQGFALAAADPAGPLPGGHHRARIAYQDADIQAADVDAQFQGRGGDHPEQAAAGQPAFDVATVLGQKSGPVGGDFALEIIHAPLRPHGDQFGHLPRLGIDDGAQPPAHRSLQEHGRGIGR